MIVFEQCLFWHGSRQGWNVEPQVANICEHSVPICSYLFHSAESHDLVKAMSSIRKEFHGEATGKEKVPGASWCFVAFEDVWKVLEMLESLSKSIIHYNSINL
jgi:hypothetical protein